MSLENKIDKKQWIPVIGLGKAIYDVAKKKPSMLDNYKDPKTALVYGLYVLYQFNATCLALYKTVDLIKYLTK